MKIRPITVQDVPAIAEYEKEISLISFGDEAVTDMNFHQQKLIKAMPKEKDGMLVMDDNGKVCGWLWMAIKINSITNEKYVNFKSFYIDEAFRGTDYPRQLLETGMNYCKKTGARNIVGKVHAKNLAMRVLYKNCGFEPTHITMEYKF